MQTHQPTLLALAQSAKNGCQLCLYLWDSLGNREGDGEMISAKALVTIDYPGRELGVNAWTPMEGHLDNLHIITTGDVPDTTESEDERGIADPTMPPDGQIAMSGYLDIFADPGKLNRSVLRHRADSESEGDVAALEGGVTGRPMPCRSGTQEDFDVISHWMNLCIKGHKKCARPKETTLPDRIVDVGSFENNIQPRLVENKAAKKADYVTLSHCWGGSVPLTTTSMTLKARQHRIALDDMPLTFREAVITTRKLGFQYIWIDSLCILQDSKSDWETQAAKMAEIYSYCVLTLAARSARNATEGLFLPRPPSPDSCAIEHVAKDAQTVGTIHVREPSFRHENPWETPLEKRK